MSSFIIDTDDCIVCYSYDIFNTLVLEYNQAVWNCYFQYFKLKYKYVCGWFLLWLVFFLLFSVLALREKFHYTYTDFVFLAFVINLNTTSHHEDLRLWIIFFRLCLVFEMLIFFENSRGSSEYCNITQEWLI